MRLERWRRIGWVLLWVVLDSPVWAGPSFTDLVWTHPNPPDLAGFELLLAAREGDVEHADVLPVGLPGRDGIFTWSLGVPENESIWVAVVAVDRAGERSRPSGWHRLSWNPATQALGRPGRPYLVREVAP